MRADLTIAAAGIAGMIALTVVGPSSSAVGLTNLSSQGSLASSGPTPATITAQQRLDKLGDQVLAADAQHQIATTEVDPASLTLIVRLKGTVPQAMRTALDAAPKDINVKVEPARYSMSEMQAAGVRVHQAAIRGDVPLYGTIVSNNDGSGLTVSVPQAALAKSSNVATEADLSTEAGIPARVVPGELPQATSRVNDADPWSGGAAITGGPGGFCSTGFAVLTSGGFGRLLSAAHCDFYGNAAWNDGSGQSFTTGGSAVSVNRVPYDTLIMDPVGGTQGRVYAGPYNAASTHSRYTLKVGGSGGSHVNDFICTSGANSGEHCSIQVRELGVQWLCGINKDPSAPCGGHHARNTIVNTAAAVTGDSGGPVYAMRSDGRVTARGIVSAGYTTAPCPPSRTGSSGCFRDLLYPAISVILDTWNVSIETTP